MWSESGYPLLMRLGPRRTYVERLRSLSSPIGFREEVWSLRTHRYTWKLVHNCALHLPRRFGQKTSSPYVERLCSQWKIVAFFNRILSKITGPEFINQFTRVNGVMAAHPPITKYLFEARVPLTMAEVFDACRFRFKVLCCEQKTLHKVSFHNRFILHDEIH